MYNFFKTFYTIFYYLILEIVRMPRRWYLSNKLQKELEARGFRRKRIKVKRKRSSLIRESKFKKEK
jgi:hypothetical protein